MSDPGLFPFFATLGSSSRTSYRVHEIQFGDGYKQSIGDGINKKLRVWNVSFDRRPNVEARAIMDYLDGHSGLEPFDWQIPGTSEIIKARCKGYTTIYVLNTRMTISATFEELSGWA